MNKRRSEPDRLTFGDDRSTTRALHKTVDRIDPLDELEDAHKADVLTWITSGNPIYRTAKPATPPKHLVSYCVLVDPQRRSVLLVDHRDATSCCAR